MTIWQTSALHFESRKSFIERNPWFFGIVTNLHFFYLLATSWHLCFEFRAHLKYGKAFAEAKKPLFRVVVLLLLRLENSLSSVNCLLRPRLLSLFPSHLLLSFGCCESFHIVCCCCYDFHTASAKGLRKFKNLQHNSERFLRSLLLLLSVHSTKDLSPWPYFQLVVPLSTAVQEWKNHRHYCPV